MADVATNKLYESKSIIVWEMLLEPNESTGIHTHHHNFIFYVIQGSTLEIKDKSGNLLLVDEVEDGRIMEFNIEHENIALVSDPNEKIPRTHQATNVGTNTYKEILIEFKTQRT